MRYVVIPRDAKCCKYQDLYSHGNRKPHVEQQHQEEHNHGPVLQKRNIHGKNTCERSRRNAHEQSNNRKENGRDTDVMYQLIGLVLVANGIFRKPLV